MTIDRARLVAYTPVAAGLLIVVMGWALFIRPLASGASQDERAATQLHRRAEALRGSLLEPLPVRDTVSPADVFLREVAARDAVPQLMEQLARFAMRDGALNLMIETGERAVVPASSRSGPQVAGAVEPDPRLALFEVPLAYVPITMSFDADYAGLGNLLWHLRDLPTLVEIRSVEVKPQRERGAATLRASITLFAYAQQTPARVPAAVRASSASGASR